MVAVTVWPTIKYLQWNVIWFSKLKVSLTWRGVTGALLSHDCLNAISSFLVISDLKSVILSSREIMLLVSAFRIPYWNLKHTHILHLFVSSGSQFAVLAVSCCSIVSVPDSRLMYALLAGAEHRGVVAPSKVSPPEWGGRSEEQTVVRVDTSEHQWWIWMIWGCRSCCPAAIKHPVTKTDGHGAVCMKDCWKPALT